MGAIVMVDTSRKTNHKASLPPFVSSRAGRTSGQSDDYFRRVLDELPAAIYATDAVGRITYYNDAAVALWGYRPEFGQSDWCRSWKLYRPDGTALPHEDCSMAIALKEKRVVNGEETITERPDGSRVSFIPFSTPLFDASGALIGAVNMLVDLTDRMRMEEFGQRLAAIVETSDDAIISKDLDGVILSWNKAAERLFGYTAQEAIGKPVTILIPTDHLDEEPNILQKIRSGAQVDHYETIRRRKDGSQVSISLTVSPIKDAMGVIVGASKIARDITDRKRAEELSAQQKFRLDTLNRIALTISRDLDLERVVQKVTDVATELSGGRFGALVYKGMDQSGEMRPLYTVSGAPREAFEKFGMPRSSAIFDPRFREMGIIRSDDIRKDPRYGKLVPHRGLSTFNVSVVSYLAVPVIGRDSEVLGGLFFGHDQPGIFSDDTEKLMSGIAAHAAIAIGNARLHKAAQIEIGHRRRAEEAAQRLAAIVEYSDDAILTMGLTSIITSWNNGAEQLFGYTAAEAIGQSVKILIPVERQDEEPAILARVRAGEHIDHYETMRRRKDGSLVAISLTVSPVKDVQGAIVGVSKIARDITERRQSQEQQRLLLREMNHRVKNLFALSSSVVSLSARSASTAEDLAVAVRNRLDALARAHALTLSTSLDEAIPHEQATTLHSLIGTILLPYEGRTDSGETRVMLSGADIDIAGSAVTSLALLLHEFATNAAKYGALSSSTGNVHIQCSEDNDRFLLTWTERGGPAIDHQTRGEGFGSLLARATIKGRLGGEISHDWNPLGLIIRLSIIRDRLTGSQPV